MGRRTTASLRTAFAMILFVVPSVAHAQATLLTGLGGPAGFGIDRVPETGGVGFSGPFDITPAFPAPGFRFFGRYYTSFYVNIDGHVTFGAPLGTFTPVPFPASTNPMIAPFWADVDTRGGWTPTRNGVYWALRPGLIVVTWHNVGYFSLHDDRQNSFQIVIRDASTCVPGDSSIEFRYARCEWTTGDSSGGSGGFGGTPAQAGFDAGDRINFVTLPGSRTMSVLNLCRTSNVGVSGVWRFEIRGGALTCAGAGERCEISANVGACRDGVQQCRATTTVCAQTSPAAPERCDGVDNDCNDMTDDGAGLCPTSDVCDRGACVPRCVPGGCLTREQCTSRGVCEETGCAGVTCLAGQRCRGGSCLGACDGVYCPPPTVCRIGRCIDPCDGVTCVTGEVCELGRCVPHCRCRMCEPGALCNTTDGRCVDAGCAGVICPMGEICRRGVCADPCVPPPGLHACPDDQMCDAGRCVPRTTPRDAGDDSAATDASSPGEDASAADTRDSADVAPSLDAGGSDGGLRRTETGCACGVPGSPTRRQRMRALLVALAVAAIARRGVRDLTF